MRILFPTLSFYPAQIGGPNNTLYWHTRHLKEFGAEPIIVTTTFAISPEHNLKSNNWLKKDYGNIIYLTTFNLKLPIKLIFKSLSHFNKVDLIHFNSIFSSVTILLIFLAVVFRKKVILSPRGELFGAAINRKTKKKKIVLWLYRSIKKRILFHATSFEETETIKTQFGNVKIVQQANFIYPEYSHKPFLKQKDFVFLGRINPIKNIDLLIKGASESSLFLDSTSKIIIAGNALLDYEKKYLDQIINIIKDCKLQKKVELVGYIEGTKKTELLKTAYFLVLPSKSENFGNVVIEALSCSTPVIASKGTPWKILEISNSGYWVENNSENYKHFINKALSLTDSEYQIMTENAINLVKNEFDVNSKNNHWLEIYSNLINDKK